MSMKEIAVVIIGLVISASAFGKPITSRGSEIPSKLHEEKAEVGDIDERSMGPRVSPKVPVPDPKAKPDVTPEQVAAAVVLLYERLGLRPELDAREGGIVRIYAVAVFIKVNGDTISFPGLPTKKMTSSPELVIYMDTGAFGCSPGDRVLGVFRFVPVVLAVDRSLFMDTFRPRGEAASKVYKQAAPFRRAALEAVEFMTPGIDNLEKGPKL